MTHRILHSSVISFYSYSETHALIFSLCGSCNPQVIRTDGLPSCYYRVGSFPLFSRWQTYIEGLRCVVYTSKIQDMYVKPIYLMAAEKVYIPEGIYVCMYIYPMTYWDNFHNFV